MPSLTVCRTGRDTPKDETLPAPAFGPPPEGDVPTVWLDPGKAFQTVLGVGGAFTESAAVTLAKLDADKQRAVMDAYFDPERGAGYSVGRVHMNSCDFSLENWACCDRDGDFTLETFSIDRYREAILPMLAQAKARAGDALRLYFSPWSPPAWMKTTGMMNKGGKLKPECRAAWALHYAKFARAFEAEGFPFWGLTVQNEPEATQTWDSCIYTGAEERDFVRDHLGPTLRKEGLGDLNVMIWDHNRDRLYERAAAVYDDPEAAQYVWGAAFHWYVTDSFNAVKRVAEAWPEKGLMFSEGCWEGGPRKTDWAAGERYGRSLYEDFNNGAHGWTDWNLILDEQGGPNHVGNFCSAPVMVDTHAGTYALLPAYYILKYFSRAARPGSRRIAVTTSKDELEATAFRRPDGSLGVVVQNRSDKAFPFALHCDGQAARLDSPAHSVLSITVTM